MAVVCLPELVSVIVFLFTILEVVVVKVPFGVACPSSANIVRYYTVLLVLCGISFSNEIVNIICC